MLACLHLTACRAHLYSGPSHTPPPSRSVFFLLFSPLYMLIVPRTCAGFYASLARAGGEARVRMLLTIAKLDHDGDGVLSPEEITSFERVSQKLVDNTCTTLQNFAVVGSLLFSSTYLSVIGRPVPWKPSDPTADMLSPHSAGVVMWLAYGLATWITTFCLTTIVYSVGSRFMLTCTHTHGGCCLSTY